LIRGHHILNGLHVEITASRGGRSVGADAMDLLDRIPVNSEANRRGYIWDIKATSPIMTAVSALHKRAVPKACLRFPETFSCLVQEPREAKPPRETKWGGSRG